MLHGHRRAPPEAGSQHRRNFCVSSCRQALSAIWLGCSSAWLLSNSQKLNAQFTGLNEAFRQLKLCLKNGHYAAFGHFLPSWVSVTLLQFSLFELFWDNRSEYRKHR
jgi:hypothetical protein